MAFRNKKVVRVIALVLLMDMLAYTFSPTVVYALTAGPNSPEFASFTPVATTDMVNLFTGDFNYNLPVIEIPGADGAGYALSLNYQSGYTSEQEASWVGFGWFLSPGSINRSVRGFPDDSNGDPVKYYNKMRPNWSTTVARSVGLEAFSKDVPLNVSARSTLRFNNQQGFYKAKGFGIGSRAIGSLNVNFDNDGVTFSGNIDPMSAVRGFKKRAETRAEAEATKKSDNKKDKDDQSSKNDETKSKKERQPLRVRGGLGVTPGANVSSMGIGSLYGSLTHANEIRATSVTSHKGFIGNWSISSQINPSQVPVGVQTGQIGTFSFKYNQSQSTLDTYGYLNSGNAGEEDMQDYFVEKGSMYDKRDVFIGMPFANYDVFGVAGEGLMGSFRGYNQQVGHYRPNKTDSDLKIRQMGYEFMVGTNLGVGLDFGIGSQKTEVDDWNVINGGSFSSGIFRFANDQGGVLDYTDDTKVLSAETVLTNKIYGFRNARAYVPPGDTDRGNLYRTDNSGRSSYINPSTDAGGKIIGYEITNEGGMKYTYDVPVYVRNETSLSVDISDSDQKKWRYLAFRDVKLSNSGTQYDIATTDLNSPDFRTAIGEIRNDPYVNNFLLTSILTPQYVDRTGNGITQDDFGGWTKFDYRTRYGDGGEWYRYRTPYNGLIYNQNAISDTKDDVGSFSTGEKQVKYLDNIETNTHKAYFVTNKTTSVTPFLNGSGSDRYDGLGAVSIGTNDPAASKKDSGPHMGTTMLEYLEKIVLVAKNSDGTEILDKPLKTVHFEYDWSLVPNVANNQYSTYGYEDNGASNLNASSGKLTLKKVWFEYRGVKTARISPYEFEYSYLHSSEVEAKHGQYFSDYDNLSDNAQNCEYAPHLLSPWSYPMTNGRERKEQGIPWIDQGAHLDDQLDFDPASWQLKQIKLPSGGKILIQYEADDYSYVQDRPAMAMASLLGDGLESDYEQDQTYHVDIQDLGVDPADVATAGELVTSVRNWFLDENGKEKEKIYFKFLYALIDIPPSLDDCRSEYITGYANFKSVQLVDFAYPDGQMGKSLQITLTGSDGPRAPIPRQACYELVSNQRQGKLDNAQCEERDYEAVWDNTAALLADADASVSEIKKNLAKPALVKMSKDGRVQSYRVDDRTSVCKNVAPSLSFLKLPMIGSKKGGGLRVKRLLMYDQGLEEGAEVVYGNEYHYQLEDGRSSGVATTEPGAAREENPLVAFIAKGKQDFFNRITAGEDKEQTEGPLGESLLPAASVGYARVVVQNIHTGKTGTGYSVHDFYTARDYPFDRFYGSDEFDGFDVKGSGVSYTELESETKSDFLEIPAGLFNYSTSKVWTAQGFRFILNDMHGKVKRVGQYGGTFISSVNDGYQVAYQEYEYYEPGEKIRVLRWDNANNRFVETLEVPGKEMDLAFEARRVEDTTIDFSIEIDISIGISFLPPIFVNVMPSFDHSDRSIATHATTKVLRYPSMLKRTISNQDGVTSINENIAFNGSTGSPILTRSFDSFNQLKLAGSATEHDGSIYQFSVPAEWMYQEMGQKAVNSNYTNQLAASTATFVTYGREPDPAWFTSPSNVLSASIETFSKNWSSSWTDPLIDAQYGSAASVAELNQVWRPQSSWVYKADGASSQASQKIYASGYYTIDQMFDWTSGTQTDENWIKTSEVTKYTPNGNPVEERNVLDIPSAVIYGEQYGNHLPVMIAQNATYNSIYFQDYENTSGLANYGHSGNSSREVVSGEVLTSNLSVTEHLTDQGGLFMAWLRFGTGTSESLELDIQSNKAPLTEVSRVGEWSLYRAEIDASVFSTIGVGNLFSMSITSPSAAFGQVIAVDDVRFQPWDAEATCYVYDASTFDLIAQFDDQHFGLYYQYNDEGQLIRKSIETERGRKTVQETQYNLKKASR